MFLLLPPSICHEVIGPDAMILVFRMLRFKPTVSLSSFTFIKRLFSSSLFSAIRVVSSVYLRLLILLPEILIPASASFSPAFHMMYSAHKLNKQGDNIQPWCMYSFSYLEPVCCSMSSSSYCFLTYIQISHEADKVVWYSHLLKNFPQFIVIYTVKGFGMLSKTEVDIFLDLSCFFDDPVDVGNLILVPLSSLNPASTSGSSWFMYCWSLAWTILSITFLACEMSAIVW